MQEDIEHRTVTLIISGSKFTMIRYNKLRKKK